MKKIIISFENNKHQVWAQLRLHLDDPSLLIRTERSEESSWRPIHTSSGPSAASELK